MNALGVPSGHSTWNFVLQHSCCNLTTPMGSSIGDSTSMMVACGRRRWIASSRCSSSIGISNCLLLPLNVRTQQFDSSMAVDMNWLSSSSILYSFVGLYPKHRTCVRRPNIWLPIFGRRRTLSWLIFRNATSSLIFWLDECWFSHVLLFFLLYSLIHLVPLFFLLFLILVDVLFNSRVVWSLHWVTAILNLKRGQINYNFLVDKSKRRLSLWAKLFKVFPIDGMFSGRIVSTTLAWVWRRAFSIS